MESPSPFFCLIIFATVDSCNYLHAVVSLSSKVKSRISFW